MSGEWRYPFRLQPRNKLCQCINVKGTNVEKRALCVLVMEQIQFVILLFQVVILPIQAVMLLHVFRIDENKRFFLKRNSFDINSLYRNLPNGGHDQYDWQLCSHLQYRRRWHSVPDSTEL